MMNKKPTAGISQMQRASEHQSTIPEEISNAS
jgi:hypothetical protein